MTVQKTAPKPVEYKDDPALSARFRSRMEEIRDTDVKSLTIAERLMRRAFDQKFTIPFPVETGDPIPVEVRMPLAAELEELIRTSANYKTAKTESDRQERNRRVCEILGSLCIDPSLDAAFFESGAITIPDLNQIVLEVITENRRRTQTARSFRENSVGPGDVPDVPESRKVPS